MLALLAVLVFSPTRILPDPFLPNRLEPLLPVKHLVGVPRVSVTRGGSWRPGGFVRINYYYRFPEGTGPTHLEIKNESGFQEVMGFNGVPRSIREQEGIRQVVGVADLEEGIQWKWANIVGPARVVTVTEFPLEKPSRWHYIPQLEEIPVPPGYPPNFRFLKGFKLEGINSDPLIPRGFRTSYGVTVKLTSQRPVEELWREVEAELKEPSWTLRRSHMSVSFSCQDASYGLVKVDVMRPAGRSLPFNTEITLTYVFADQENGPRIE